MGPVEPGCGAPSKDSRPGRPAVFIVGMSWPHGIRTVRVTTRIHVMKRESQRMHPALLSPLGRHTVSQAPHPRDTLELADTPNAVPWARLHTADLLSRWGVPSEAAETVQLLVSELVTNAVQHPQEEGEERQVSILSSRNTSQTFELTLEKLSQPRCRPSAVDASRSTRRPPRPAPSGRAPRTRGAPTPARTGRRRPATAPRCRSPS